MPDAEYDQAYQELLKLEDTYPQYRDPNSITQRVGGVVLDAFTKVTHKQQMLSLSNAFNLEDLQAFDERVRSIVSKVSYVVELKMDGLAISLHYHDGRFVQAVTRGDGFVGEDAVSYTHLDVYKRQMHRSDETSLLFLNAYLRKGVGRICKMRYNRIDD